jgi:hypothetical protein
MFEKNNEQIEYKHMEIPIDSSHQPLLVDTGIVLEIMNMRLKHDEIAL